MYVDALPDDEALVNAAEEWIKAIQTEFVTIRQSVLTLRTLTEENRASSIAQRLYNLQERNFHEHFQSIQNLVAEKCLPETLANERTLFTSLFKKLQEVHSNFISIAPEDVAKDLLAKMSNNNQRFNQIMSTIDTYVSSYKKEAQRRVPFRLEKMPLPSFDGHVRHYPRFKKDFSEIILPNVDPKEAAFTLRQCLHRNVNDFLGCCEEDVGKMLKRLDTKYGDPCKIMDSIISDIHKFKKMEPDDNVRIIQFVDILEKAHHDLKGMGLEKEITNANTISIIENKLPKTIQMGWYRKIYEENSAIDKTAKFPSLLKFLSTKRGALNMQLLIYGNPLNALFLM